MVKKVKPVKKILKIVTTLCVIFTIFLASSYLIFYYTNIQLPLHSATNVSTFVKTDSKNILLLSEGIWRQFKISGVNIKDTIPGGKQVTYDMYMKWFAMIAEMNANTIQADDIMGTEFYRALHDYNTKSKEPLYLMQTITLDDKEFDNMIDIFSGSLEKLLSNKAYRTVDVIHGSSKAGKKPYTWDVSDWTLGYIVGTDWDQDLVIYSNNMFADRAGYNGKYIATRPNASAFETVLAKVGDRIFSYETSKYGEQRLVGYRNWTRTDPLFHDSSWSVGLNENIVNVNIELIGTYDTVKSGVFAAYHVEPNYPQFLSFDPVYSKYVDEEGNINPYKGYLEALNKYHKLPVLISNFGVPASRGVSNIDEIRGFNQGGLSEKEQGRILKALYEDIMDAGLSGGFIGSWSDDWNQTAWNTKDAADNGRRAYWSDAETSTQFYGLLAIEPGQEKNVSYVDGEISEWSKVPIVTEKDGYKLQMMYDEKYLYFHVQLNSDYSAGDEVYIPLDITPESGASKDETNELSYDRDMDFVIIIDGADNSRILVNEYYNNMYPLFGYEVGEENIYINKPNKDDARFDLIKQLSRKSMTDEKGGKREAILKSAGILRYGNSNPDSGDYDSLADFIIAGNNIEIRVPWALLNFSDPSKMMIHDNYYKNYGIKFMNIQELYAALTIRNTSQTIQVPSGRLELKGWEDSPKWHTRLKKSYHDVQDVFSKYKLYNDKN